MGGDRDFRLTVHNDHACAFSRERAGRGFSYATRTPRNQCHFSRQRLYMGKMRRMNNEPGHMNGLPGNIRRAS
ncbi:MAG: hypothetical protein BWY09_01057 [Candidatus Hydrogenedentes bacterium ADurb.Bin179]|nr:MAG: hypothetical protein BWY09_01057 [Candidatus Hydrogenedentes bacterium ADurb.Bin179]